MVLGHREVAGITIDAAARGIDEFSDAGDSHSLEQILGEVGAFPEIDIGLGHRLGDVGVRGVMIDTVGAVHRGFDSVEILEVAAHDREPLALQIRHEMPFLARGKIVKHRDRGVGGRHERAHHVAADKARPARYKYSHRPLSAPTPPLVPPMAGSLHLALGKGIRKGPSEAASHRIRALQ